MPVQIHLLNRNEVFKESLIRFTFDYLIEDCQTI